MRIALVQCPAWGALPPLGPAALKGYLQQHGHEARCFDFNIEFYNESRTTSEEDLGGPAYGGPDPWGAESFAQWSLDYGGEVRFQEGSIYNDNPIPAKRWAEEVLAWAPRVVGFTTYITSITSSLIMAQEIRKLDPSVLLVFGGPSVAEDQEADTVLRTGIPDLVVHGEGESTLLDIVEALEGMRDVTEVKGTGRLVGGSAVWNQHRPLVPKVDSLPFPDFSDYRWSSYPNPYLIPIMASRGCVLDCAFCYETVYWKRFRIQSPERIVDEIEYQVAHHPLKMQAEQEGKQLYFMFADSLVNGHLGGLRRTCELLIERQVGIGWGGQATINTKMDEDFCRKLSASGCTGLAFGLESGSQRVLENMGKHFRIDDAEAFIRRMHEAGVTVTVNIMVGFPTERRRDFLNTLLFLRRTRRWLYQVSNVTTTQISLGSELHLFPERFGVTVKQDGSWESPETGGERDRQRRLRFLHVWMRVFRIPHQNIAPG